MIKERLYCAFSYNVHDSSVAFSINESVVLVLEAERIFREKRKRCDKDEMEFLIKYGLKYLKRDVSDVEGWAMTTLQNPLLWDDQINIFDNNGVPKEPFWMDFNILGSKRKILIINHHLAHAATYYLSDFKNALVVTCDGGGDSECSAVFKADNNNLTRVKVDFTNFINGKFYGACSYFIYQEMHCEGKMMALAGYGKPNEHILEKLEIIIPELNRLHYFDSDKILKNEFPKINDNKNIFQKEKLDFAASVQQLFSEHRVKDISRTIDETKINPDNLVMAGGVSLNLDTNTEILNAFPNIKQFIAPCCDDTGQSLGALSIFIMQELDRRPDVKLPYLGVGAENVSYDKDAVLKAVDILNRNGIVILHNSKAEIGPRALGNRSLIARPDSIEVKEKLSEKIKQRESYRPVAPVTIEEKVNDYFSGPKKSPFMLYKYDVVESQRKLLTGAVHHDGSARVQTVTKESNSFLYDLIKVFGDNTGTYVLLNTSLNLKGDPITNSIEDSLNIYSKIDGPKILIYNGTVEKMDF